MVINIFNEKQIFSMTLPKKTKGQFWLTDIDELGKSRRLISVEADNGQWVLKSNKLVSVLDANNNPVSAVALQLHSFFRLSLRNSDSQMLLFSEPVDSTRQSFCKFVMKQPCEITIGRGEDNNICYSNKFVSSHHAKLCFDGINWSIVDTGSTNGTFVNGYRVESQPLENASRVYIMGLKIVVGKQFFAINNPDNSIKIKSDSMLNYVSQKVEDIIEDEDDYLAEDEYYYRSPRFKREIEEKVIEIDSPPAVQKIDEVPMALMLGPSMTMGLTSVTTGAVTVTNVITNGGNMMQAIPTMMMSVSMLLGTIMWPIITKKHEKKLKVKNEKERQKKYLFYLDTIRDEVKRICKEQSDILNENIITDDECVDRIVNVSRNLWERSIEHNDFLRVCVGKGNLPMFAEVKYAEKHFTMEDDNLFNAMYSLGEEPKNLINVPISISLVDNYVAGLIGERSKVTSLCKSIILQLVALHSYDELKLVLICDEQEFSEWEFMKWLPHIWNDEKTQRFMAVNLDEVKELSTLLDLNVLSKLQTGTSNVDYSKIAPYYCIISASRDLADKCEAFGQILKYGSNIGCSIVTLYDEIQNIPKETSIVVEVNDKNSKIFDKDDLSGKNQLFETEDKRELDMNRIAYSLANISMDLTSQRFALPKMMTFLEMFSVGKVEHLNILTRWKENNPVVSLSTPVGVDTLGETFSLDLHEKFHGPHGLVAGMTGSGKSEFIITYILSLAVNYHPDEVAFILIDYKGGGLTGAFENPDRGIKLPHLAGTITNLDGAAVKRSLISIQSELRRRQAVFNDARKAANEGTMDIYKYQQLYRQGVVTEPVPHLFIISDEFAELKSQQPEFMEQLISAARIGRSLGVHLILATQKPSGVVDDQIWSNSKFRVCLKVQEKADSNDMIKCPDAAELTNTGRFYLQVGFNELFALGQSAWCGAKYVPKETVEKTIDKSVQVVDNLGRVIKDLKPAKKEDDNKTNVKQVVRIVEYLSELATEENIKVRPLWLDPIPAKIYVDNLEEKYSYSAKPYIFNPVIGEYDDPFNQSQKLLTLPVSDKGNAVIFGATGNGKTTYLTTFMYSLIKHHSAKEVNLYVMDFGAETLKAFEKAPQVGSVLFSYEGDKIINLMKMLIKELDDRKKLFSEFGGDYNSYINNSSETVPYILVLINNYAGMTEQYEELDETFTMLTRDGGKYGISFIITASATNAVKYRTMQNFRQVFTLQLNDQSEYSSLIGKTNGLTPTPYKGRGLVNLSEVYEFQTAYASDAKDQFEFIRKYCDTLRSTATEFAKQVPVLPKIVDKDSVKNYITDLSAVPAGIYKKTLLPANINIKSKYIYPVISHDVEAITAFASELVKVINGLTDELIVVDSEKLFADRDVSDCSYLSGNYESFIVELFSEVVLRNNTYKDANMDEESLKDMAERVYIICGIKKIMDQLSDDGKDKFKLILEKGQAIYKLHFIIIDNVMQFGSYNMEAWYRNNSCSTDGIYIGDGFADQYVLKTSKVTSELYEEIGDRFGYVVTRSKPVLTKVLCDASGMEEDIDE